MKNNELEKLLNDDKFLDDYLSHIENSNELISINENASLLDNVLKEYEKEELKEMQKISSTTKERNKFVRGLTKFVKISFAAVFAFAFTASFSKLPKIEMPEKNEQIDEIYENYSNFMLTQIDFNRLVDRSSNINNN